MLSKWGGEGRDSYNITESFTVNRESTRGYSLEVYREKYFGENGWNVGSQRRDSEGNES